MIYSITRLHVADRESVTLSLALSLFICYWLCSLFNRVVTWRLKLQKMWQLIYRE